MNYQVATARCYANAMMDPADGRICAFKTRWTYHNFFLLPKHSRRIGAEIAHKKINVSDSYDEH